MEKHYMEIRKNAWMADVSMYDVAVKAGISESTMTRWLREPERDDRRKVLAAALDAIVTGSDPAKLTRVGRKIYLAGTEPKKETVCAPSLDTKRHGNRAHNDMTERKSKRLNLLIKPTTLTDLHKIATMKQTSVNELIQAVMQEFVISNTELVTEYDHVFSEEY